MANSLSTPTPLFTRFDIKISNTQSEQYTLWLGTGSSPSGLVEFVKIAEFVFLFYSQLNSLNVYAKKYIYWIKDEIFYFNMVFVLYLLVKNCIYCLFFKNTNYADNCVCGIFFRQRFMRTQNACLFLWPRAWL